MSIDIDKYTLFLLNFRKVNTLSGRFTMSWEIDFLKFVIENLQSDKLNHIMTAITTLGNAGMIWIVISAVFVIIPETRAVGITMFISLIIEFITVNILVKPLINRARPFEISSYIFNNISISMPRDGSFPSGHTAAAFAAATAAFCCRKKIGIILLIFALLMGVSRLYFAVHFPTDVLAGGVIGGAIGVVSYRKIYKKIVDKRQKL